MKKLLTTLTIPLISTGSFAYDMENFVREKEKELLNQSTPNTLYVLKCHKNESIMELTTNQNDFLCTKSMYGISSLADGVSFNFSEETTETYVSSVQLDQVENESQAFFEYLKESVTVNDEGKTKTVDTISQDGKETSNTVVKNKDGGITTSTKIEKMKDNNEHNHHNHDGHNYGSHTTFLVKEYTEDTFGTHIEVFKEGNSLSLSYNERVLISMKQFDTVYDERIFAPETYDISLETVVSSNQVVASANSNQVILFYWNN